MIYFIGPFDLRLSFPCQLLQTNTLSPLEFIQGRRREMELRILNFLLGRAKDYEGYLGILNREMLNFSVFWNGFGTTLKSVNYLGVL